MKLLGVSPALPRVICCLFLAAVVLLPEENGMAEAILRTGSTPDSHYVVPSRDMGPYKALFLMNNMHSSCPNGLPTCKDAKGRKTHFKAHCHATLFTSRFAVTARHCFCHQGDDVAYTAGFNVWIAGRQHKVRRTWVDHGCQFKCDSFGRHNPCDLAVIELEHDVRGVRPLRIYDSKFGSEKGAEVTLMGYGATGRARGQCPRRPTQDGKLRRARVKVASLGPEGDTHNKNKNRVLRLRISDRRSKIPQGLMFEGEGGAPAFVYKRGEPILAGIHAGRHRDWTSIRKPCSLRAQDEFVRLSSFRGFLEDVVRDRTRRKLVQSSMHKRKRYLDMLPYKARGQGRFPWNHSKGHRRRYVPRSRVLQYGRPGEGLEFTGTQRCRLSAEMFLRSMAHKVKQDVCDNAPRSKWPLKFFRPGLGKAMQTIINHQNIHVSRVSGHKIILGKGKRVSKAAMSLWINREHKKLLNAAYRHFNKKAKKAKTAWKKGKKRDPTPMKQQRNAKHPLRRGWHHRKQKKLAKKFYKMVLPLENRVKELKRKVRHQRRSRKISRRQLNLVGGFRRRAAQSPSFVRSFFPDRRRRSKFRLRSNRGSRFHRKHVYPQNHSHLSRRRRTRKRRGSVWTNAGNPNRGRRGLREAKRPFRGGGRMARKDVRETLSRRRRSTYRDEESDYDEEEDDEEDAENNVWHHERDSDEEDDRKDGYEEEDASHARRSQATRRRRRRL